MFINTALSDIRTWMTFLKIGKYCTSIRCTRGHPVSAAGALDRDLIDVIVSVISKAERRFIDVTLQSMYNMTAMATSTAHCVKVIVLLSTAYSVKGSTT